LIDLGVLDEDVHVDGTLGSNLRGDFQLQHRVDVLHRNGVVNRRLNGNLHTLLYGGLFVVLGNDAGLREQFADALGLRCGNEKVDCKIWRAVREAKGTRRNVRAKVDGQRYAAGARAVVVWRKDWRGQHRREHTIRIALWQSAHALADANSRRTAKQRTS